MAYPVVFHPGTSALAQATAVELGYGDDRSSIDLVLTPVPSVRVSGVVDGPQEALAALTVRLLPVGLENLGLGAEAATALVAADGHVPNVPAGDTLDAPVTVSECRPRVPPSTISAVDSRAAAGARLGMNWRSTSSRARSRTQLTAGRQPNIRPHAADGRRAICPAWSSRPHARNLDKS
jgi:hypothetical protein